METIYNIMANNQGRIFIRKWGNHKNQEVSPLDPWHIPIGPINQKSLNASWSKYKLIYKIFGLLGHAVNFCWKVSSMFVISSPCDIQLNHNKMCYKYDILGCNSYKDNIYIIQNFTRPKVTFKKCPGICQLITYPIIPLVWYGP